MKKAVLNRYERSDDGIVIIDVSASRIEDLYNNFDKSAPYLRRDLDQDLVDYLIDCAKEIGSLPFVIRFTLTQSPDEGKQSRIKKSVYNFFNYLGIREKQKLLYKFRRSAILFVIGLAILFAAVWVNKILGEQRTVVMNVLIQGLTVAAWVSLWEAIAIFLIEWLPLRKHISLYQRLAKASLMFRSLS
ncbi:MAG: hypothetical protein APR63_02885 [Desulfuromonas sp. SDB]|nr:MAG: hypothetical protein APR63_02885 [Desulfuromonas sp. SDB]